MASVVRPLFVRSMPGHRNIGVERAVLETDAALHPPFLSKSEGLVHSDCALIALTRFELDSKHVRKVAFDSIEQGSEKRASNSATLPSWMHCDGELSQDVGERCRTKRICVNLASKSSVWRFRNQLDASVTRGVDKVGHIIQRDFVRSASQASTCGSDRAVKCCDLLDVRFRGGANGRLSLQQDRQYLILVS